MRNDLQFIKADPLEIRFGTVFVRYSLQQLNPTLFAITASTCGYQLLYLAILTKLHGLQNRDTAKEVYEWHISIKRRVCSYHDFYQLTNLCQSAQ